MGQSLWKESGDRKGRSTFLEQGWLLSQGILRAKSKGSQCREDVWRQGRNKGRNLRKNWRRRRNPGALGWIGWTQEKSIRQF